MAMVPVPFVNNQESGLEELAGGGPLAMNVVVDGKGAVRRRPGIGAADGVSSATVDASGLDGIWGTLGGKVYVTEAGTGGRNVYEVGPTTAINKSIGAGGQLVGPGRPVFAETEMLLVVANGQFMQKLELATGVCARLGGTPPQATHVVSNSLRLLANDVAATRTLLVPATDGHPGAVHYTAGTRGTLTYHGHELWPGDADDVTWPLDAQGVFNTDARPDPVLAIVTTANALFILGATSMESWVPDATDVYVRAHVQEVGCSARYSVVRDEDAYCWLDEQRRVIRTDGRSVAVLSDAIQQTLSDMDVYDDCFGYKVQHGAVECFVWTFPTDGRTFVFQKGGGWSQWSGWNDVTSNWARFGVNGHHQRAGSATNLVCTTSGRVGALTRETLTDFGTAVPAEVRTGYRNHDTEAPKQCHALYLGLKRGKAATGEPRALVSWRDDGGDWCQPVEASLGRSGDFQTVIALRGLGTYRRRQWRFQFTGTDDLVLASAMEEVTITGSESQ
jgi:hypothetical protein